MTADRASENAGTAASNIPDGHVQHCVTIQYATNIPAGEDPVGHVLGSLGHLGAVGPIACTAVPIAHELEMLGLDRGAIKALMMRGITTTQALTNHTETQLGGKGVGWSRLRTIIRQLHAHGLKLAGRPNFEDSVESLDLTPNAYVLLRKTAKIQLIAELVALDPIALVRRLRYNSLIHEIIGSLKGRGLQLAPPDLAQYRLSGLQFHPDPDVSKLASLLMGYGISSKQPATVLKLTLASIYRQFGTPSQSNQTAIVRHFEGARRALGIPPAS